MKTVLGGAMLVVVFSCGAFGEFIADGALIGLTEFTCNNTSYGSNHDVIEGPVPLAWFGDMGIDGARMWWTMTCANDIGRVELDAPTAQLEVPESGTLMPLGSGLLFGLGGRLRRRMK